MRRYFGKVFWIGILGRYFGQVFWAGILGRYFGKVFWAGTPPPAAAAAQFERGGGIPYTAAVAFAPPVGGGIPPPRVTQGHYSVCVELFETSCLEGPVKISASRVADVGWSLCFVVRACSLEL